MTTNSIESTGHRCRRCRRLATPVLVAAIGLPCWSCLPASLSLFNLLQVTVYLIFAILALSLGFVFGFGGILCLGQAMFLRHRRLHLRDRSHQHGQHDHTRTGGDRGGRSLCIGAGLLHLLRTHHRRLFWRHHADDLADPVQLDEFDGRPGYHIGKALLGGINGIPAVPALEWPFRPGAALSPKDFFRLTLLCLLVCYFGLTWLLRTHFGRVVVAVRENERRAELPRL